MKFAFTITTLPISYNYAYLYSNYILLLEHLLVYLFNRACDP